MKIWAKRLYFGGLILAPIILLILPANFFDNGPPMCLSVVLFHRTCPGCGMTRGIMHLIHFDFKTAAFYNKLAFIVLPFLVFGWGEELRRIGREIFEVLKGDS